MIFFIRLFINVLTLIVILEEITSLENGEIAVEGDFKYIVAVKIAPCGRCAGVIINSDQVLTAAHCVTCTDKSQITIMAGVADTRFAVGIYRNVRKIDIHPEYYSGVPDASVLRTCYMWTFQCILGRIEFQRQTTNDIAILTLGHSFHFGGNLDKLALPQPAEPIDYCTPCIIAAWNMTVESTSGPHLVLYWTTFNILPLPVCRSLGVIHRNTEFCAMDLKRKARILPGDSGSVLVCNGVAVGVTSMSSHLASQPTIFTQISSHRDFIDNKSIIMEQP